MKTLPVILVGFGPVGRAFAELLAEKMAELKEKYGLSLRLEAILRRSSALLLEEKVESLDKRALVNKINDPSSWSRRPSLDSLLQQGIPGVLVEVTTSDLKTGQPGYDHIKKALTSGWHVVTANKGPLLVSFSELHNLAKENNLRLKFSGATAAALPALDVGLVSLAGTEIRRVEGILNGTSNYLLTRMAEGASYSEALKEAQEKGIAEKNPAYDVEGWDTAVKLALLSAAFFGVCLQLEEMEVVGINQLTPEELRMAKQKGLKFKLIGSLWKQKESIKAKVRPELLNPSHALFFVDGTNKGISFVTDSMGTITLMGGQSDPRGAAAALLKDIINIYHHF